MKIVSYNIMFNDFYRIERLQALVKLLLEVDADIICLQEVMYDALFYLKKRLKNYSLVEFPDSRIYKEVIFYKNLELIDQKLVILQSEMNRSLTFATFKYLNKLFTITTFHLESLENSYIRSIQMKRLVEIVKDCEIPIICCGDSNLKAGEPGLSELCNKFTDLGVYYGNTKSTSYGDRFFGTTVNERYDRVWVNNCKHHRFEHLGDIKIPDTDYWISDHNGILFGINL